MCGLCFAGFVVVFFLIFLKKCSLKGTFLLCSPPLIVIRYCPLKVSLGLLDEGVQTSGSSILLAHIFNKPVCEIAEDAPSFLLLS